MIQQVVNGVQWIPGKDRFLPDSHVYVIGKPGGDDFSLVDCGLMGMGSYKLEQLDKAGVALSKVRRIVMTHTHLDHIGCLPELLKDIPHAEVWMHKDEALYLERGDDRIVFGNSMFEAMIRAQMSIPKDLFRFTIHRKLEGEEILDLGGVSFRVVHVPGHSAGSIGLFNEEHRMFMSGDTIYADGAIGRYDLHSANPAELRQSLEKIAKLGIDILLPCHNRIVPRGADSMVKNTVRQWAPILG
ncbi:MAG: MBL fold metallo-hydrolase [Thermodesulfobacteriota bacterium]